MSFLLLDSEHFAGMTRDQWEEWLRERLFAFADNASSLVDRGRITAIVHGEAKHITDISFRALPKRRDPTIERERNQPHATDSAVEPEVNEQDGLSPCRSGGEIRDQVTATKERAANSDFEGRLSEREGTVSEDAVVWKLRHEVVREGLEAALAALDIAQRDSARLDWLEGTRGDHHGYGGIPGCSAWGISGELGASLREVIDEQMAADEARAIQTRVAPSTDSADNE